MKMSPLCSHCPPLTYTSIQGFKPFRSPSVPKSKLSQKELKHVCLRSFLITNSLKCYYYQPEYSLNKNQCLKLKNGLYC